MPSLIGAVKGIFSGTRGEKEKGEAEGSAMSSENLEGFLKDAPDSEMTDVREFATVRDLLAKTKFRALVVLIDDLDRCSPGRIVENLEAIKLFLNVGNAAFVIGADSENCSSRDSGSLSRLA